MINSSLTTSDIPIQIAEMLKQKEAPSLKAERIFLSCTPAVFHNDHKGWSEIRKRIANHLKVPKHSVLVCGSAMIGFSFIKFRAFDPSISDLDIAIISSELFIRCIEDTMNSTDALNDQTSFDRHLGQNSAGLYTQALAKGFIYTKYLPNNAFRKSLDQALRVATQSQSSKFNEITCAIYASEKLFIEKQTTVIKIAGESL